MGRKIALFCALIGLVAFVAAPAFAEVQNIKISGDIEAKAVYREAFDLQKQLSDGANPDVEEEDKDSFLMSVIRLQIDADLTDNVAACIRLANLREWDVVDNATTTGGDEIVLDLANITLKEMLYSPLTLIIGRQELNYGNGLIVGGGQYHDPSGSLKYRDLSPLHGFDAVRGILDYDPWVLDLVFVKIEEGDDAGEGDDLRGRDDDVDLYGANLGYVFGSYDAEVEGYLFYKRDPTFDLALNNTDLKGENATDLAYDKNEVYTIGLRGSVVPMDNLSLNGEIAGQFGTIYSTDNDAQDAEATERDREALAVNVAGEYSFEDVRFAPVVGVEYLYLSGHAGNGDGEGDFEAWDPMYRGKIMGSIRDYLETLYDTDDAADTSGWTNQHTVKAAGSLDLGELVDGLSLSLAYLHYWFAEDPLEDADDHIGDEINLKVTYDYTEDVQFALDGACFVPGDYYDTRHIEGMSGGEMSDTSGTTQDNHVSHDTAVSIIGSCKVTF